MPNIDLSILNQRQTPAFFADTLANRPAAGFLGRIFVSTDTYAFYRDNGTGWDLIGGPGTGTITGSGATNQVAFWNGSSSITGENNLWWDSVNNHFGINTNTPGTALDIHHDQSTMLQLNQTTATNDSRIAFQNSGTALWRIGNFYNAGANDWGIFDVVGAAQPFTIKKTTGQTFIGAETTSSGRLVVNNTTGDNHIVVIGATAPSIRINNAGSGATRRIGIGLATTTNNFIQGTTGGEMAIFNSSTTASPILFGVYDAGLTNTQEAARISAARNFLIGTSVDGGQKLQINGGVRATGYYLDNMTAGSGALYYNVAQNRVTLANYNASGILDFEVNGGTSAMTLNSDTSATFKSNITQLGEGLLVSNAGTPNLQLRKSGVTDWGNIQYDGSKVTIGTFAGGQTLNVTTNGNLGLGVTPNSWTGTNTKAFQFGNFGALGNSGTFGTILFNNSYYDSGYKYITSNPASAYVQDGNTHIWYNAPSGTAGNAISFTQAMTLSGSTGNLLIGTSTDDGTKLQVKGNVKFGAGNGNRAILDSNDSVITLGPGGTTDFDNYSGMLLVCNHNSGAFQIFVCGGGSTASVYLLGGAMGTFTYNLAINGYTFTNNTASTYIYNFTAFRTRNNA